MRASSDRGICSAALKVREDLDGAAQAGKSVREIACEDSSSSLSFPSSVMVIGDSFIFAWMRLKSGSLWTGVLLHASHNLFIQAFFDPMTTDTGRTRYIIGEFGCGLALVVLAFAIYFWSRRREVEQAQRTAVAA